MGPTVVRASRGWSGPDRDTTAHLAANMVVPPRGRQPEGPGRQDRQLDSVGRTASLAIDPGDVTGGAAASWPPGFPGFGSARPVASSAAAPIPRVAVPAGLGPRVRGRHDQTRAQGRQATPHPPPPGRRKACRGKASRSSAGARRAIQLRRPPDGWWYGLENEAGDRCGGSDHRRSMIYPVGGRLTRWYARGRKAVAGRQNPQPGRSQGLVQMSEVRCI